MQIQKVANVNVLQAEGVWLVERLLRLTRRVVIDLLSDIANVSVRREHSHIRRALFSARYRYLYSLNLELDVPVLRPAVEFRVPVDVVHRGDMVCDQGQYFLPGFLHVVMQLRIQTRILNIQRWQDCSISTRRGRIFLLVYMIEFLIYKFLIFNIE